MKEIQRDEICENCNRPSQEHYALNHADGAYVSMTVIVCPTSVFRLQRSPARKKRTNRL
jgi:hypothetical protein